MKRVYLLAICAALFWCTQILLNCSSPLESASGSNPSPPPPGSETVYVHDTLKLTDTLVIRDSNCDSMLDTVYDTVIVADSSSDTIFDTTIVVDTISDTTIDTFIVIDTVLDTVIHVDTLVVPCQDSCNVAPLCTEFNQHNKKIYWNLHNDAGSYHLVFTATVNNSCSDQILHIHINGHKYEWDPKVNSEFILDISLKENTKIMIHCKHTKGDGGDDGLSWGDDDDCDDHDDDHGGDGQHHKGCDAEVCLTVTRL